MSEENTPVNFSEGASDRFTDGNEAKADDMMEYTIDSDYLIGNVLSAALQEPDSDCLNNRPDHQGADNNNPRNSSIDETNKFKDKNNLSDNQAPSAYSSPGASNHESGQFGIGHAYTMQDYETQNTLGNFYGRITHANSYQPYAMPYVPTPSRSTSPYPHGPGNISQTTPFSTFGYDQFYHPNAQPSPPPGYAYALPYAPPNLTTTNLQSHQMPPPPRPNYGQTIPSYIVPDMRSSTPQLNYSPQSHQFLVSPSPQQNYPPNVPQPLPVAVIVPGQRPLAFANLAQAEYALANRNMSTKTAWIPNPLDKTVAHSEVEQAHYVRSLLDAMMDISGAHDNTRHWQPPIGEPFYDPTHVEKACWVIVTKAVALHIDGPRPLAIYDSNVLENVRRESHTTFQERIRVICDLLRYSKSRCDRLMKGESFETVVAAPRYLLSQSRTNKDQNGVKQRRLNKGFELEKNGKVDDVPKVRRPRGRPKKIVVAETPLNSPGLGGERQEVSDNGTPRPLMGTYYGDAASKESKTGGAIPPTTRVTRSSVAKRARDEVEGSDKDSEEETRVPARRKRAKR